MAEVDVGADSAGGSGERILDDGIIRLQERIELLVSCKDLPVREIGSRGDLFCVVSILSTLDDRFVEVSFVLIFIFLFLISVVISSSHFYILCGSVDFCILRTILKQLLKLCFSMQEQKMLSTAKIRTSQRQLR